MFPLTDAPKKRGRTLYKIQYSFLRKDLNNSGIKGNFHVLIKGVSERPTANTKIDEERLTPLPIRQSKNVFSPHCTAASSIKQDRILKIGKKGVNVLLQKCY